MRRFVILDRDGTLIVERHYLSDPGQVELVPGAAAALRQLDALGLGRIVVTNQSAVGRGFISLDRLAEIHRRMGELLRAGGASLDGIYSCPHLPEDGCRCRKPLPGLVEQAALELGFVPAEGFVVGDKRCDLELGRAVGARTFLVRTGYGARLEAEGKVDADYVTDDLPAAVRVIQQLCGGTKGARAP
jgi:D-glycero-D-manno-heptose 1,7-bisphosphate phosphatase